MQYIPVLILSYSYIGGEGIAYPMQYIVQIKEDINVRQQEEESTGAVVVIQSGSGLIKLINHRVGYERGS